MPDTTEMLHNIRFTEIDWIIQLIKLQLVPYFSYQTTRLDCSL